MSARMRLDQLLVQQHGIESREKAQALIRAGRVQVKGQPATKPGVQVPVEADVMMEAAPRYVGRGGEKLEAALTHFQIDVTDLIALDVGASTGGFTDCLLQHGAAHVYAVDVGKGQLHWKLRQDERVTVHEGCNARYLEANSLVPPPQLAVVDVSFISLTKVLPAVTNLLARPGQAVTLIKPQFEAGREQVGKGGVVRDPLVHQQVIERVRCFGEETLGWEWVGHCRSPIKGPAGNYEFLAYWRMA
jgi:23S rRNA (cytidine1920-2'-O)/16S rRNA (cytidine1409-2'-O)-methyltransferase